MAKAQMKYEGETGKKLSGYAYWVLALALATSGIFVAVSFSMVLG